MVIQNVHLMNCDDDAYEHRLDSMYGYDDEDEHDFHVHENDDEDAYDFHVHENYYEFVESAYVHYRYYVHEIQV